MVSNAVIVESIQRKIDQLVEDVPKLLKRLRIFMVASAVSGLFVDQEPVLQLLRPLAFNNPCIVSPRIRNDVVSNRMVDNKRKELRILSEELVMLFGRIENVVNWETLVDICSGCGRIVTLPEREHYYLSILDVYIDHLEAVNGEQVREAIREQLNSAPSSAGSFSVKDANYYGMIYEEMRCGTHRGRYLAAKDKMETEMFSLEGHKSDHVAGVTTPEALEYQINSNDAQPPPPKKLRTICTDAASSSTSKGAMYKLSKADNVLLGFGADVPEGELQAA